MLTRFGCDTEAKHNLNFCVLILLSLLGFKQKTFFSFRHTWYNKNLSVYSLIIGRSTVLYKILDGDRYGHQPLFLNTSTTCICSFFNLTFTFFTQRCCIIMITNAVIFLKTFILNSNFLRSILETAAFLKITEISVIIVRAFQ